MQRYTNVWQVASRGGSPNNTVPKVHNRERGYSWVCFLPSKVDWLTVAHESPKRTIFPLQVGFEASNFTQVPLQPSCGDSWLKAHPLSNELSIATQWSPLQSEKRASTKCASSTIVSTLQGLVIVLSVLGQLQTWAWKHLHGSVHRYGSGEFGLWTIVSGTPRSTCRL